MHEKHTSLHGKINQNKNQIDERNNKKTNTKCKYEKEWEKEKCNGEICKQKAAEKKKCKVWKRAKTATISAPDKNSSARANKRCNNNYETISHFRLLCVCVCSFRAWHSVSLNPFSRIGITNKRIFHVVAGSCCWFSRLKNPLSINSVKRPKNVSHAQYPTKYRTGASKHIHINIFGVQWSIAVFSTLNHQHINHCIAHNITYCHADVRWT